MKIGQVYKSERPNDVIFYVVINDYGKYRPLNLNGLCKLSTNMSEKICPKIGDARDQVGFYKGDVLVSETFEEFLKIHSLTNTSDK
ncbi:MAG: hypothetical protein ACKOX6_18345 [Bdellovibrio sp.]